MPTIDEEPLETIHLYMIREEAARPSLLPVFLALLGLSVLLVLLVGRTMVLQIRMTYTPRKIFPGK